MSLGLICEILQCYYEYVVDHIDYIQKNHRIYPVAFTCNIVLTVTVEDGVFNKYIVYFANCL